MSDQKANGLGLSYDAGETDEAIRQLLNAYVFRQELSNEARQAGYYTVLEEVSKVYRLQCPLLLCGRVWDQYKKTSLARNLLPNDAMSNSERALIYSNVAGRWRLQRRCYASEHGICRALRAKEHQSEGVQVSCGYVSDARAGHSRNGGYSETRIYSKE